MKKIIIRTAKLPEKDYHSGKINKEIYSRFMISCLPRSTDFDKEEDSGYSSGRFKTNDEALIGAHNWVNKWLKSDISLIIDHSPYHLRWEVGSDFIKKMIKKDTNDSIIVTTRKIDIHDDRDDHEIVWTYCNFFVNFPELEYGKNYFPDHYAKYISGRYRLMDDAEKGAEKWIKNFLNPNISFLFKDK